MGYNPNQPGWQQGQQGYPGQGQPGGYPGQGQQGYPGQGQPDYPQQNQPGGWGQPTQQGGWSQPTQQGGYSQQGPGSYPPAGQPSYVPGGQPGYPPQGQPGGWQQPGYPGYPGVPAAVPPKRGNGPIILIVVLAVLLIGAGASWFLFLSPSHSSSPFFDRHGVPANVPLPNGLTYNSQGAFTSSDPTTNQSITATQWAWQVSGLDPAAVQQFYQDNMPGKGWGQIQAKTGEKGDKQVLGCQGTQVLVIDVGTQVQITDKDGKVTSTVDAPAGGSALGIAVASTNSPALLALLCTPQGQPTP